MPIEYTDTQSTTSTTALSKEYTVSGAGWVIMSCSIMTDSTSDVGNTFISVYKNEVAIGGDASSVDAARAYVGGASVCIAVAVANGDTLQISMRSTKGGTKTAYRTLLAFGCTLT